MKKRELKQILRYAEDRFEQFPDRFLDFPEFCQEFVRAHPQFGAEEVETSFREMLIGNGITDDIEQRANALYRFQILVPRNRWAPFQNSNVGAAQFYTGGRLAEFDGYRIKLGEPDYTDIFEHLYSVASTSLETKSVEELAESFLEWRKTKKNCPIDAEYIETRIVQMFSEMQRPRKLESPHKSVSILMMAATPIKESYKLRLRKVATVLTYKKTNKVTKYSSFDKNFVFEKNYDVAKPEDREKDNGQEEETTSSEKDKKGQISSDPDTEAAMETNQPDWSLPSSSETPPHGLPVASRSTPNPSGDGESILEEAQVQAIEQSLPTPIKDSQPACSSSFDSPAFSETVMNAVKIYSSLPSSSITPLHRLPTRSPPISSCNSGTVLEAAQIQSTEPSSSVSLEASRPAHTSSLDTPSSSGTIIKPPPPSCRIPPHRLLASFRPTPIPLWMEKKTSKSTVALSHSNSSAPFNVPDFMGAGPSTSSSPSQPSNPFKSLSKIVENAGADSFKHPQPTKHFVQPPPNPSGTPTTEMTAEEIAAAPTQPKPVEPVSGDRIFDYSPNMDEKIKNLLKSAVEQPQQPEQVEPPKLTKRTTYPNPVIGHTYASPEVEKFFLEKNKRLQEAIERARNKLAVAPVEAKRLPKVMEEPNSTETTPDMDPMELDAEVPMPSKDKQSTSTPWVPRSQFPKFSAKKNKTSQKPYAAFLNSISNFPPGLEKTIGLSKKMKKSPKVVPKPSMIVETIPATVKRSVEPQVIGPVILSEPPPSRPEQAQVKIPELNQYMALMTAIAGKMKFPLTLKQIERRYKASGKPIIRNLLQKIPHYNKLVPTSKTDEITKVRLMFITQMPVPERTENNLSKFTFHLDSERKIVEVRGENLHLNRVKSQQANVLAEVNLSDTEEEVRVPEIVVLSDSDDEAIAYDLPTTADYDDYDMAQAGGYTHEDVEGEEDSMKKTELRLEEISMKIPEANIVAEEEPEEDDSEDNMTEVEKHRAKLLWESVVRLVTQKARRSTVFLEWKSVYDEIKEKHPEVQDSAEQVLDRIKQYVFFFPDKWRNIADRYFILYVYRIEHSKEEQQQLKGVGSAKFDKHGRLVELCSRDKKVQFGLINNSIIMTHLKELAATLKETKSFESLAEMFLEWRCLYDSPPPIEINYLTEKYKEVGMLIQSYNTLSLITRIRMLWITGIRVNPVFKNKLKSAGKVEIINGFVWKFKTFRLGEEFDILKEKFIMEEKEQAQEQEDDDGYYGDPGLEDEMDYMQISQDDNLDYNHEAPLVETPPEEQIPERSEQFSPGHSFDKINEDPMLEASDATPDEERTPERSEESSPPGPPELGQEKESIGEVNEDPMLGTSDATPTEERSEQSTPPVLSDPKLGQGKESINEDPLLNTSDAISAEERTPERSEESSPPVPFVSTTPVEKTAPEDTPQSSSQVSPTSCMEPLEGSHKIVALEAVDQENETILEISQELAILAPAANLLRQEEDVDPSFQVSATEDTQEPSSSVPSTSDSQQDFDSPNQNEQIPRKSSESGYEGECPTGDHMTFEAGSSNALPESSGQALSTSPVDSTHQITVTLIQDRVSTVPVEEVREEALDHQVFHPTSSIFGSFDPIRRVPQNTVAVPTVDEQRKSRRSQNLSSTTRKTSISSNPADTSIDESALLSPHGNPQVVAEASKMSSVDGQLVSITKESNVTVEASPCNNLRTDVNNHTSQKSTHNPLNRISKLITSLPTTIDDATLQSSRIDPAIQKLIMSGYFSNPSSSKSAVSQKDVVKTQRNNRPTTINYEVGRMNTSQVNITSTPQPSTSQPAYPLLTAAMEKAAAARSDRNSTRGMKRARKDADNIHLSTTHNNSNIQKMNTSQWRLTSTPQSFNQNPAVPNFFSFPPLAQLAVSAPQFLTFPQSIPTPNLPLLTPQVTQKASQKRGRVSTEQPAIPEKRARQEVEQHGESLLMKLLMEPSTITYAMSSVAPAAATPKTQIQAPGPSSSAVKLSEPNDIAKEKCETVMAELRKDLVRWEHEDDLLKLKAPIMPVDWRNKYNVLIERIQYYVGEFYELLLMSNISKDVEKDNSMTIIQVITMISGESQAKSMGFKEYFNGSSKREVVYDMMWRVYDVLKEPKERSCKDDLKTCMDNLFELLF